MSQRGPYDVGQKGQSDLGLIYKIIIPHVNFRYKTYIDERLTFGPRRDKTCLRGMSAKRDSSQSPRLQRLARILKFRLKQV